MPVIIGYLVSLVCVFGVFIMHGGRDGIVPYDGGVNMLGDSDFIPVRETVALWTTRNGCAVSSN